MFYCPVMTEFEARLDDIDVERILARVEKREPFVFSRRRCIYQAPEFTQRLPAHETVEEGSTVTFGCKVLGFPKPTVTWYKDDDVIGSEARADLVSDENGVHSLKLQDVSKCDAGNYRVSATNLEGSSSSSLCITVKAKSKNRNRKKKKTRQVACAPLFPVIVEHEAEERRETLAAEQQDDSPLTPLYTNISRRSPVSWPEFLGEWAYNTENGAHHEIDLEIGCEDVFENESDHSTQESLTFVSSVYANQSKHADGNTVGGENSDAVKALNQANCQLLQESNQSAKDSVNADVGNAYLPLKQSKDIKPPNTLRLTTTVDDFKVLTINDVINNNKDKRKPDSYNTPAFTLAKAETCDFKIPPKVIEDKYITYTPTEVSQIAVNRSYATGNATFSVATRSSSPYRTLRNSSKISCNGSDVRTDSSTLQNQSNERILQRMRRSGRFSWRYCWKIVSDFLRTSSSEDDILEAILLICGCTFLALLMDLPPSTFVFDILVALFIKFVFSAALNTYDSFFK